MYMYNIREVSSSQSGIHHRLQSTVIKHINSHYQKPFQQHNLVAYNTLLQHLNKHHYRNLILDSGCGTGMSTNLLAQRFPDSLVVGIDQSAHRLNKAKREQLNNVLLLQTNCEDFWRLCLYGSDDRRRIMFKAHYMLYPNPWPKSVHLKRRWHGHPVFPVLPNLSDQTVVRSNWKTYMDEFALSWHWVTGIRTSVEMLPSKLVAPMTLFERKYSLSGHKLYALEASSNLSILRQE